MLPIFVIVLILALSAAGQWYFSTSLSKGKHSQRLGNERKA
ncbi:hypothetical protein [[Lactobacillus] timonensis]|jgi:hypothetical protein|nr:hypothetical protein [[Lactobacillus] timonensis]